MKQGSIVRWGFPDFLNFEQGLYFFAPFDGNEPFEVDFTGSLASVKGQIPTGIPSGTLFVSSLSNRYGERTKAVQIANTATNLVENPSFETNTNYVHPSVGGVTLSRTIQYSVYGNHSLRVDCDGTLDLQGIYTSGATGYISVSASTAYTLTAYVKSDTARSMQLVIAWYDAGSVYISSSTTNFTSGTAWARQSLTATSPGTAAKARIYIRNTGGAIGSAWVFWVDAMQFEARSYSTPYLDGSLNGGGGGYSWSGTVHNSTSTRTRGAVRYRLIHSLLNGGSASFWYYVSSTHSAGQMFFYLMSTGTSENIHAKLYNGQLIGRWGNSDITTGYYPSANTYHHVAMTYDNNYITIYCDGNRVLRRVLVPTLKYLDEIWLYLGCTPWNDDWVNGWIKDLAIWDKRVLTDAEIKDIYQYSKSVWARYEGETCNNVHYVANKDTKANITHVFAYDDSTGIYTENLANSKLPRQIFDTTPAINDIIYFGCESTALDSGWLNNIILEFARINTFDYNIYWEIYTSSGWVRFNLPITSAATRRNNYDETQALAYQGSRAISWVNDLTPATTAINNVTGYWIRAIVASNSAYAPGVLSPVLSGCNPYSCAWNNLLIDNDSILGDIQTPAMLEVDIPSAPDYLVGAAFGIRSVDRGSNFVSVIELSDTQPSSPGISIVLAGGASYTTNAYSNTMRCIQYSPAAVTAYTTIATLNFSTSVIAHCAGKYRVFARCGYYVSTGFTGAYQIRYKFSAWEHNQPASSEVVERAGYVPASTGYMDFITFPGELVIPENSTSASLALQVKTNHTSTTVYLYELVLIPCDESYAQIYADLYQHGANMSKIVLSSAYYGGVPTFILNDLSKPKKSNTSADMLDANGNFIDSFPITSDILYLSPRRQQRLYIWSWASILGSGIDIYSTTPATIFPVLRIRLKANGRYLTMRGGE